MLKPSTPKGWTTDSEIKWLNTIGDVLEEEKNRNMPVDGRVFIDRKNLLRGYLEAAKNRSNWGAMDRTVCINHAKLMLAKMEGICK
jgi:hypothetical protein